MRRNKNSGFVPKNRGMSRAFKKLEEDKMYDDGHYGLKLDPFTGRMIVPYSASAANNTYFDEELDMHMPSNNSKVKTVITTKENKEMSKAKNKEKEFYRKCKNCTFMYLDIKIKMSNKDSKIDFGIGEVTSYETKGKDNISAMVRVASFSWRHLYFCLEHANITYDKVDNICFSFNTLAEEIKNGIVSKGMFIDWKSDIKGIKDGKELGSLLYKEMMAMANA